MRRYTGDPVDKPTIFKKINNKGMPPTKKIKMEDGKYKVLQICVYKLYKLDFLKIPEGEDNALLPGTTAYLNLKRRSPGLIDALFQS